MALLCWHFILYYRCSCIWFPQTIIHMRIGIMFQNWLGFTQYLSLRSISRHFHLEDHIFVFNKFNLLFSDFNKICLSYLCTYFKQLYWCIIDMKTTCIQCIQFGEFRYTHTPVKTITTIKQTYNFHLQKSSCVIFIAEYIHLAESFPLTKWGCEKSPSNLVQTLALSTAVAPRKMPPKRVQFYLSYIK